VALVKFDGLHPGAGGFWIDLEHVMAIIPLFGTPPDEIGVHAIGAPRIVQIGSRVAVGKFLFDLNVLPDDLAAEVASVRGLELTDYTGLQPASGSH
jgi:hypothetical protein